MSLSLMQGLGWRGSSPDHESARQALTSAMDMDAATAQRKSRGLGLFSKRNSYWAINRHGVQGNYWLYWNDLFHTLLNMPRYRFIAVFFCVYIIQYMVFALFYLAEPDHCIKGVRHFSHALWFSVQTASTLGYGNMVPDINCSFPNFMVMIQVILSSLIDYAMLGVVFARFAAPHKRSSTIRFSQAAVVHCDEQDGSWRLVFRVANIRKHPILKPKLQVLLATPDEVHGGTFTFEELQVENLKAQQASLKLGLPVTVSHVVGPSSPLWGTSLDALAARDVELLVFLDGMDAMTSNSLQARHAYSMADIRLNEQFAPVALTHSRGRLGLDFSGFDITMPCRHGLADEVLGTPPPPVAGGPLPASLPHRPLTTQVLRSTTFQELSHRTHSKGGKDQTHSTQVQALCAAVLSDPVSSDALKRLALHVQVSAPVEH